MRGEKGNRDKEEPDLERGRRGARKMREKERGGGEKKKEGREEGAQPAKWR